MLQLIVQILRDLFGWPSDESPEPTAIEEFAAANPDLTAEDIAARIDGWLDDQSAGKPAPPGYRGTAKDHLRYASFSDGVKYWRENTNIALGVITLPVVSQDRIAYTVEEWRENQRKGVSYLGFRLFEPDSPMSVDEWNERQAAAVRYDKHSAPWYDAGMGETYRVLTIEGLLKKWVPVSFVKPAELYDGDIENFYNSNLKQILDNLHAARRMGNVRAKWLTEQGWAKNPAWRD